MTADTSKSLDLHAHPEVGASPAASKDAPTDEEAKRAMDWAEAMRSDSQSVRGYNEDPEWAIQTLAAHVATLTAKLEAERAKVAVADETLHAIAAAPAWGAPERWEPTPSEVRALARQTLAKLRAK